MTNFSLSPHVVTQYSVLPSDEAETMNVTGSFFSVKTKGSNLVVKSLSFPSEPSTGLAKIYYKSGTHAGHERVSSSWTMAFNTSSAVASNGSYALDLQEMVFLDANSEYSFFVTSSLDTDEVNSTYPEGTLYKQTDDLEYYIGKSMHSEFVGCLL